MSAPDPSPEPEAQPSTDDEPLLDEGDISLIHWMLSLTPTQRLEALEGFVNSVQTLRDGRITTS
jgi:hypothetical protein